MSCEETEQQRIIKEILRNERDSGIVQFRGVRIAQLLLLDPKDLFTVLIESETILEHSGCK